MHRGDRDHKRVSYSSRVTLLQHLESKRTERKVMGGGGQHIG